MSALRCPELRTAVEPGGMRTRFAEPTSLRVVASDPVYVATVVGTISIMQSAQYSPYLSDPAGHATLVCCRRTGGTSGSHPRWWGRGFAGGWYPCKSM